MSDGDEKQISYFELAQAKFEIEALWMAARAGSHAREKLLALEMIVQGLAAIRQAPADDIRGNITEWLSAMCISEAAFKNMPPQGSA